MTAKTLAKTLAVATALAAIGHAAAAETIEVQMLNRGEAGAMVFEPSYVAAQPGDTILFVSTDPGHNAASIEGMLPEGVEPFESEMNEDFLLLVEAEGLYGVECTPHAAMGMVALIQVGEAVNLEAVQAVTLRGKAEDRFAEALDQVQ